MNFLVSYIFGEKHSLPVHYFATSFGREIVYFATRVYIKEIVYFATQGYVKEIVYFATRVYIMNRNRLILRLWQTALMVTV